MTDGSCSFPVELVVVDVGVVGVREAVGEEPVAAEAGEEEQHEDGEDEHEVGQHAQHLEAGVKGQPLVVSFRSGMITLILEL